MTVDTIDTKIKALEEQEEGIKVMFHKIQGAKETLLALKAEMVAELDNTDGTVDTKKKEKVKK